MDDLGVPPWLRKPPVILHFSGVFQSKPSSYWGTPITQETSMQIGVVGINVVICTYFYHHFSPNGGFLKWGYPKSWRVFVRENPIVRNGWWLGVPPWLRKPPNGCCSSCLQGPSSKAPRLHCSPIPPRAREEDRWEHRLPPAAADRSTAGPAPWRHLGALVAASYGWSPMADMNDWSYILSDA